MRVWKREYKWVLVRPDNAWPRPRFVSAWHPTWDRPRQSLVTGAGETLASWSYVSQECVRPSHPARHISLPQGPGAWALGCQHKNTLDTGEILTQRQRMNGPMADGWGLPHNGNIFNRSINVILNKREGFYWKWTKLLSNQYERSSCRTYCFRYNNCHR